MAIRPNAPPTVAPAIVAVGVGGGEVEFVLEDKGVVEGVAEGFVEEVSEGGAEGLETLVESI